MIKISKILDALGKFITLFFLLLVFFRCLKISFNISCLLSLVITSFLLALFKMIKRLSKEYNGEKEEDLKNIEKITEQFTYSNITQIKRYLMNLFSRKYQTVTSHKFGFHFGNEKEKQLVYLCYLQPTMDLTSLLNIYREILGTNYKTVHIFCFKYDAECLQCLTRFKKRTLELYDISQLYYTILKPANSLPNFDIEKIYIPKYSFKTMMYGALSKRKAKSYFWFGMLLFVSSFFVPMSIYYLIFALVLFTLSFVSRFVIKHNETPKKQTSIWN